MNNESLIAEVNALKLNAQIAHAAKLTELLETMQNAIDSHGLKEHLVIEQSDDMLQLNTNDQYNYITKFGSFSLRLHDFQVNDELVVWIYDSSNDRLSKSIKFYINLNGTILTADMSNYAKLIASTMLAMNDMLHALNDLMDSDNFKSYENDILAYFDACKNLENFKCDEEKRRRDKIARELCAGMKVVSISSYDNTDFKIVKACKKRISYDGYICFGWGKMCNRSTLDREFIASQIARNKWKIVH